MQTPWSVIQILVRTTHAREWKKRGGGIPAQECDNQKEGLPVYILSVMPLLLSAGQISSFILFEDKKAPKIFV